MGSSLARLTTQVDSVPNHQVYGRVSSVLGMLVEVSGINKLLSIGSECSIQTNSGKAVKCEVVGFNSTNAKVLPFGSLEGIGPGNTVELGNSSPSIFPDMSWLGRVINAFGEPIDGKGPLAQGTKPYPLRNSPPPPNERNRVGEKIDLGVRGMNTFVTTCKGQRLGIFSGSGVGKSILLSMMAKNTAADVSVVGLIGERGREAKEFIEDDLGTEGMETSILVLATSDEPPLVRRQAAYLTMALSEFFRDNNKDVLCLMDSVTRFAMAQREISLSAGEPPATRGYTPNVFSELPKLLERAGPGREGQGSITGLFTVLVEGDDLNEPISDSVRGILDGHAVLDRSISERGRFPAINILKSISRTMPECNTSEQNIIVNKARKLISTYEDMAELIRLGAYKSGSDPYVDEAITYYQSIENFLSQSKMENTSLEVCYKQLAEILNLEYGTNINGKETEFPSEVV